MEDKQAFMALVAEVEEIARTQGRPPSAGELEEYFADMHLTGEQIGAILTYLQEKRQQEQEIPETDEPEQGSGQEKEEPSRFITMYKQDLKHLPVTDEKRERELLEKVLSGDKEAAREYVESKLPMVIPVVDAYEDQAKAKMVPKEELLQEANLALVSAVAVLDEVLIPAGAENPCAAAWEYLTACMEEAIRQCIDGESGQKDMETTVVAKTNLLYEAKKYLKEENGGFEPDVKTLAEYTRMSEQEVRDILNLTGKKGKA